MQKSYLYVCTFDVLLDHPLALTERDIVLFLHQPNAGILVQSLRPRPLTNSGSPWRGRGESGPVWEGIVILLLQM